jgi:hypothetical protein
VEQEYRIGQIADHPAGHPGAGVVVIGEQSKAGLQPPAMLARLQQRDVEGRQPVLHALQRIGQRAATRQFRQHPLDGLAIRGGRGIALQLFQRPDEAQARAGELAELLIEISALGQLSGRDNE